MNLETKITIYKFTPQVFTLTPTLSILWNGFAMRMARLATIGFSFIFSFDLFIQY